MCIGQSRAPPRRRARARQTEANLLALLALELGLQRHVLPLLLLQLAAPLQHERLREAFDRRGGRSF